MGLVYAAVDFAIDAGGRWIFLESHSSEQYFWLEAQTGAPITGALAELLAGESAHDGASRGLDVEGVAAR